MISGRSRAKGIFAAPILLAVMLSGLGHGPGGALAQGGGAQAERSAPAPSAAWSATTRREGVGAQPASAPPAAMPRKEAAAGGGVTAAPRPSALSAVRSWGYQLRGVEPAAIARSPYDLVVIDYALSGHELTREQVAAMQRKPDGSRRLVLAYLSIGEAERYRFYWRQEWYLAPPAWLGKENPQWRGNYAVRYWHEAWRAMMFGTSEAYLDRIMAAGFDGAYLDRVDAYADWEGENAEARRQMMDLVAALAAYARYKAPAFVIVPQNAEELLDDDLYLGAVDGIAKEDLLYGVNHSDEPNSKEDVTFSVGMLKRARQAGKTVLVVEYLCRREDVIKVERRIRQELGFVPHVTSRTLYRLGLAEDDYCQPAGAQGRRIALVIGQSSYRHAGSYPEATHEAKAVVAALRRVGFSEVRERPDLTRDGLEHELQRFAEAARDADWAVIYYAGLGLSLDGANYIVPVDAGLQAGAAAVAKETLDLEDLLAVLKPARTVRLALLDACRPNPLLDRLRIKGLAAPAGPGLEARAPRAAATVLLADRCVRPPAPAAASVGPFASAIADTIGKPGLELRAVLEEVQRRAHQTSAGTVEPWLTGARPPAAAAFVREPASAGKGARPASAVR